MASFQGLVVALGSWMGKRTSQGSRSCGRGGDVRRKLRLMLRTIRHILIAAMSNDGHTASRDRLTDTDSRTRRTREKYRISCSRACTPCAVVSGLDCATENCFSANGKY